ncbi:protein HOMOLOG OF MAMMALIAN LYST-INTERACTING PROTEIN 5 isoform X2 [Humulus lupulus]|uniref:protein HOMOLOG OF MAMMALIAN LYST-INTERACTING PROTEIN 5 isoform X2 n=1 Tax=Humulus lupulus TaxID=3486 RepID=UPI002B415B26|nr:protein HOMOLOG OF MAMMALIAN LYST-INTERACTING PROTEIN 5 isoform X2 [Humulus lupulus]
MLLSSQSVYNQTTKKIPTHHSAKSEDKKSLKLGSEDSLYLEGFASNVFAKADKQDRAGRADLGTAKTFYAASIFFEILNQFGALQPDLEQKQKYAVWKAADIRKALKEGRKPIAGPPSGDDDLSIPSSTTGGTYDIGPCEATPTIPRQGSDSSELYDSSNDRQHSTIVPPTDQHSTHIPPQFQYHDNVNNHYHSTNTQPPPPPTPPQFHDEVNNQHSANMPSAPQTYPTAGYPSHDIHPPPANRPDASDYPQLYHQQPFPQEPHHHLPHNYPQDTTSHPYPHFQSYPSFSESSIPAVSSHYASYYQGSDASYTSQSAPPTTSYQPAAQPQSTSRNSSFKEPAPAPAKSYEYDCNYQPPPDKVAEAQKAARFAVGALAFDDVSIAVDFLRKSLELLTNPSAGQ